MMHDIAVGRSRDDSCSPFLVECDRGRYSAAWNALVVFTDDGQ